MVEDLPHRLRRRLEAELGDGETIWWVGRPSLFGKSTETLIGLLFLFGWGAAMVALALNSTWWDSRGTVTGENDPRSLAALWDIVTTFGWDALFFVLGLIALLTSLSAAIAAFARARRIAYAVTSQRVLFIGAITRAVTPDRMPFVEKAPGKGVFFDRLIATNSEGGRYVRRIGFAHLSDKAAAAAERALLLLVMRQRPAETISIADAPRVRNLPAPAVPPVPAALRQAIEIQLRQGETIWWLGRPSPRRPPAEETIELLDESVGCFGALLAVWLLARLVQYLAGGASETVFLRAQVGLFLLTFAAFSGGLGLARVWAARHRGQRTVYAVTEMRAMIVVENESVKSFLPGQLSNPAIETGRDGLGSLHFIDETVRDRAGRAQAQRGGFEALPEAGSAMAALQRLLPREEPAPLRERNAASG